MLQNLTDVRGIKAWGAHMGIKSKRRDLGPDRIGKTSNGSGRIHAKPGVCGAD